MKKINYLLKYGIVFGLSIILIWTINSMVYAAEDSNWDQVVTTNTLQTNTNVNTSFGNSSGGNSNNQIPSTNTNTNLNTNTSGNKNTSTNTNYVNKVSSNQLAYTGSENSSSIIVISLIVGTIVAVYAFKKINDYKNL